MNAVRLLAVVLLLGAAAPALAEPMEHLGGGRGMGMGPGGPPPFLENVFPPGLIMRNQTEIGLRSEQREAITRAMGETEKQLTELRWEFESEAEKLRKLLEADRVDETAALAQADKVMAIEQRIKKAHLGLLVRIKNKLDPAQQEKLRALRPARRGGGPPGSRSN
jgi:Spy/CpxP family protein refolding chaperone